VTVAAASFRDREMAHRLARSVLETAGHWDPEDHHEMVDLVDHRAEVGHWDQVVHRGMVDRLALEVHRELAGRWDLEGRHEMVGHWDLVAHHGRAGHWAQAAHHGMEGQEVHRALVVRLVSHDLVGPSWSAGYQVEEVHRTTAVGGLVRQGWDGRREDCQTKVFVVDHQKKGVAAHRDCAHLAVRRSSVGNRG
jgi:hypothetical protein